MNNMTYHITEKNNSRQSNQSLDELLDSINTKIEENIEATELIDDDNSSFGAGADLTCGPINLNYDNKTALILNYSLNYTVKALQLIAQYYNITGRLKKDKLITKIVEYELDSQNSAIVLRRKQLWFYVNEIKTDKCLKKYILFTNNKEFTQD